MKKFLHLSDFEEHARQCMPSEIEKFYSYGAGSRHSLNLNKDAYKKIRILPRVLRNVSKRDISTTVLGEKVSMPIGVSPSALQKGAHPDGECANAKAVQAMKSVLILSTYSNFSMQEIADSAPSLIKWLQIFIMNDRENTVHMVRRAEEAGFKAIVLTVDNPITPKSKLGAAMFGSIANCGIIEDLVKIRFPDEPSKYHETFVNISDDSLTWEDVAWLKSITRLPIVLKGIMTPEDAILAVRYAASGIMVSNHGARQFDGSPATIEALPRIVKAVGDKIEVYIDGGVRSGSDVFKALALGARMVFVGRPMLWGLACGGEKGARKILEILRHELDELFAFTGCSKIEDVTKDFVIHESVLCHL